MSSNGCYGNGLKNMKSDLAYLLVIISILGNRLRRQKSITDELLRTFKCMIRKLPGPLKSASLLLSQGKYINN